MAFAGSRWAVFATAFFGQSYHSFDKLAAVAASGCSWCLNQWLILLTLDRLLDFLATTTLNNLLQNLRFQPIDRNKLTGVLHSHLEFLKGLKQPSIPYHERKALATRDHQLLMARDSGLSPHETNFLSSYREHLTFVTPKLSFMSSYFESLTRSKF